MQIKETVAFQVENEDFDYSFPCLNSLSETNIKRLEVIQNSAVRSILKIRNDTPSNILHHEAYNKV
ncbi:hypothetical protein BpHYR1_050755 [Brachionus plicatilis]|uniref:Uncharacterized protein n=1 Tax=Brachionus plicatilis TaxID=10195 RepID=A0A3M7P9I1_BRAPC|nr:hypothetical protein BpHYR1_050755 [Brachionus plicatilis]